MRYLVRRTSPMREIDAWQKAIDRFFNDDFFRAGRTLPANWQSEWSALALDIAENEDNLTVEASLPGINPDDVEISVHDGVLTIKAEVQHEEEKEEEGKYYLRERRSGAFQRAVRLPLEVNAEAAEATFHNGVLTLTLPKVEEAKPKKIAVKAA